MVEFETSESIMMVQAPGLKFIEIPLINLSMTSSLKDHKTSALQQLYFKQDEAVQIQCRDDELSRSPCGPIRTNKLPEP